MKRWVSVAVAVVVVAGLAWWLSQRHAVRDSIVLYGNVDLRQIDLAFDNSQRIDSVLVQEGDRVKRGEVLATLDTRRLAPLLA
ncbi:MAG: biotin/lipoyl-binding protein, partial [Steroidobacteraceae bacterium]